MSVIELMLVIPLEGRQGAHRRSQGASHGTCGGSLIRFSYVTARDTPAAAHASFTCGYQVSVTAGTVLHRSRQPLTTWFWAAYLVVTHTPGISALQFQRQVGLRRYETAWTMLQKLRRAMVRPDRDQWCG